MNNIKKNSARKECYKSSKSGYIKKKQNTSYFLHNKYNKYKSRHNYPNKFSHYSYEYEYANNTFYEKDEKNGKNKKKDLIEINDEDYIYKTENKENISIYANNSSTNEKIYQEKTNEKSNGKNSSFNIIEEDKSSSYEQELNSSENNTIILPNSTNHCSTNSQLYSEDKENIEPNIVNFNNGSYTDVKNENKSDEFCSKNISYINLTSQDFKEAFYVPKRLNNLYNMYSNNNPLNIKELQQQGNSNFQNLSSMSLGSSFNLNNLLNNSGILPNKTQNLNNINLLLNNNSNNNNNNNLLFSSKNININSSNSNDSIQPFNLYDSHNSNSLRKMNSFDSFHSSLKTQLSSSYIENEKEKENTDILEIYVKISEKKPLLFKIRRYDDMFKTVKIFCEINKLDPKLIRPFIIYIIKALNSIYGIYNLNLKNDEIRFLKDIKDNFYNDEIEEKIDKKNNDDNNNCQINDIKFDNFEEYDGEECLINEE